MAPFKNSSRVYLLYSPHYSGCLQFLCFSSRKPRTAWLYPQPSRSSSSSSEKKNVNFLARRDQRCHNKPPADLVRWRVCELWWGGQGGKCRGGVEASSGLSGGHGAGRGWGGETHGDTPAGLTERQRQGGRLAELTNLGNTKYQVKFPELQARPLSELFSFYSWDCIKEEGRMR